VTIDNVRNVFSGHCVGTNNTLLAQLIWGFKLSEMKDLWGQTPSTSVLAYL